MPATGEDMSREEGMGAGSISGISRGRPRIRQESPARGRNYLNAVAAYSRSALMDAYFYI